MDFVEYLNYLLDIRLAYKEKKNRVYFFFSECITGKVDPIIGDLRNLVNKPIEEYDVRDWQSIAYILSLKRRKQNDIHNRKK